MPQTRDGVLNTMARELAKHIKNSDGGTGDSQEIINIVGNVAGSNFVKTFEDALKDNKKKNIKAVVN